ncbi:MAG TPA: FAD-dependent oxidoreductase [Thermoleophilaceae bacterium]
MSRRETLRVAVVGGGVAGLAAAEAVRAGGNAAEIFEAGPALGGRIAPETLGEREICLGGKNVGRRYTRFRELLARRGHGDYELFGPDSAQLVRGRVRTLSFRSPSMRARLGSRLVARGQVGGGMRFMQLAGQVRRHPASGFVGDPFFADLATRTGDPTLPEYLGTVMCRGVMRHVTVRMNAAEPDECHAGNLGSNLALVVDRFDQLTGAGFGPWIREVAADHVTHAATPVAGLALDGGRVGSVVTADGAAHDGFDGVVLAVPARQAARVVWRLDPELASLLGTVRYFPVGVVVAEYDRPAFGQRFAALAAPAGMALSNAGSYGLQARHVVRYTFSGRAARGRVEPDTFDPEALLHEAEGFLGRHAPVAQARRVRFSARAFDPGLCAYRRDHAALLRETTARLGALPGLALAGDYVRGASLEACARSGQEAAARALAGAALAKADGLGDGTLEAAAEWTGTAMSSGWEPRWRAAS